MKVHTTMSESNKGKTFTTRNQCKAVLVKIAKNQSRQTATNMVQLLFPAVMFLLLYLIQNLVTEVVQEQYGEFIPRVARPPLLPLFL